MGERGRGERWCWDIEEKEIGGVGRKRKRREVVLGYRGKGDRWCWEKEKEEKGGVGRKRKRRNYGKEMEEVKGSIIF